jgi:hypothetical protein
MKKLGIKDRAPALSLSFFSLSIALLRDSAALMSNDAVQSYSQLTSSV